MMAAFAGQNLSAADILDGRTGAVFFLEAIDALDLGRLDLAQIIDRIAVFAGAGKTEPAADVDLEIRMMRRRQKRDERNRLLVGLRKKPVGGRQDVGAEGITDQQDVIDVPPLSVGLDDMGKVGGGLFGRPFAPEIAQRIDADDGNALFLQIGAELLIDIALAAVAGIDDRHRVVLGRRVDRHDRQVER